MFFENRVFVKVTYDRRSPPPSSSSWLDRQECGCPGSAYQEVLLLSEMERNIKRVFGPHKSILLVCLLYLTHPREPIYGHMCGRICLLCANTETSGPVTSGAKDRRQIFKEDHQQDAEQLGERHTRPARARKDCCVVKRLNIHR